MKKTDFLLTLFLSPLLLSAQPDITVGGDAKVGIISTGEGSTLNVTQNITYNILLKSAEYKQLQDDSISRKKSLDDLNVALDKVAVVPEAAEPIRQLRDNAALEYNKAVQRLADFKNDVLRLAETFGKIPLNSQRLHDAKALFDEGKIREAETLLNYKEITQEGDALLAKKGRQAAALQETDSLLRIKADELALKAQLKVTDYADSLRYDSAQIYFEQSRKYAETLDNLWDFAYLLWEDKQSHKAIPYFELAIQLAEDESDEARIAMMLGIVYANVQRMPESEKMYLRSLSIRERLVKVDSVRFEPDLAKTCMNLGTFYKTIQKMPEAEKMNLRSLEIYKRILKTDSIRFEPDLEMVVSNLGENYRISNNMAEAQKMYMLSLDICERLVSRDSALYEPNLARVCMNLGIFYKSEKDTIKAEEMYLRSLSIKERLAKRNPARFEPDLARTSMNLGNFYKDLRRNTKAEVMLSRSLDIYERLSKDNPAQYELEVARASVNLGVFYRERQKKIPEAKKMYLRSLEIYERLAKKDSAQFEPMLALVCMNLGVLLFIDEKNISEAEKMYNRSLNIRERLAKKDSAQFEPDLAKTCWNLGIFYFDIHNVAESEKMYQRSLEIYERLAASNPTQFKPSLTNLCGSLSWFYLLVQKYPESQAAALRTIALDPTKNWVRTNLGHSYLLRGDWDKAKAVYEEYLKNDPDSAEAKASLLEDWDKLEKAGVMHPDMEKARKWVKQ